MLIIADGSALVALVLCDALHLLEPLFDEIRVPQTAAKDERKGINTGHRAAETSNLN